MPSTMHACAHQSHMLTLPHTGRHQFTNSHPMHAHTLDICIHSHSYFHTHALACVISASHSYSLLHGSHMALTCAHTHTSIHVHTSSCTRTHLGIHLPLPNTLLFLMCVQMPQPYQLAHVPTLTPCTHTHIHAHGHMLALPTCALTLWPPDLLVFLCCSPPESWMTAAASPVTSSWRAPTPSGSWTRASPTPKQKTGPWFSLTSRLTVKVGSPMATLTPF